MLLRRGIILPIINTETYPRYILVSPCSSQLWQSINQLDHVHKLRQKGRKYIKKCQESRKRQKNLQKNRWKEPFLHHGKLE